MEPAAIPSARLVGIVQQGGQHVDAVLAFQSLNILAGQRHEGGKHIDLADQLIGLRSGFDPSRPPGNERNTVSAFPHTELETKQVAVHFVPGLHGIASSTIEHGAVVAGEDDQRIVAQAVVFETLEISPTIQSSSWTKSP